jgi:hypothetical protein
VVDRYGTDIAINLERRRLKKVKPIASVVETEAKNDDINKHEEAKLPNVSTDLFIVFSRTFCL